MFCNWNGVDYDTKVVVCTDLVAKDDISRWFESLTKKIEVNELFDIIGGKVVIHSDALGIPCFKKVWDADKPDKEHATKVISYIVLMNKWNSPYVQSMEAV